MSRLKILSQALAARFFRLRSAAALAKLQRKKMKRVQDHVSRCFDRDSLPAVLTKAEAVSNFAKLNVLKMSYEAALQHATDGTVVGDIHFGLSTGTSGSRGVFMTSNHERAFWAGAVIGRCLPSLLKPRRIAYFLRSDNKLYHSVQTGKRFQLKHFDLNTNVDVQALEEFAPDVIMAPSYVLTRIARSSYRGSPELVISSADVLDPWDEKVIRSRFARLHHIYQATEGFLGASCALGTLHLNEDLVFIERRMLDEKHFVPVLTDFQTYCDSGVAAADLR
jgi:putative adenylate-forming enzyme